MISGRQPLDTIEAELGKQRQAIAELERRLAASSDRLLASGKAQAEAFRELARLRVRTMAAGTAGASGATSGLDAAETSVAALLRQREATSEALAREVQAAEQHRTALEADRATQAEALSTAAAAVDAAEAKTQARLQADPGYRGQLERAHGAERIAMHADEKATRSEQEQEEKGRAYRRDPLFMYLWRRHYGTPEYRAAPLFRWLDGKVARHAGFLDARPDYARLIEIPRRLREHATSRRQAADTEFEALRALDQKAREADGIPALEAAEAAEKEKLEALDRQLEELAEQYAGLLTRRQEMAAGEDEAYRQAVDILASGLRAEALTSLHDEALATPYPDDDVLINRLSELRREQLQLETAGQELKTALQQQHEHLRELEQLRAEFKRRAYDQPGHGFEDGMLVATVLANVIGGMLNQGALWRVLEQQRRFQPPRTNTTFGSGGFGRGSPWGGVLKPPGGGFRGGGRMGGGGFRTGGKF
ncbi:MAG: hypothetical protein P8Y02_02185 [Deinococcales bacterium]